MCIRDRDIWAQVEKHIESPATYKEVVNALKKSGQLKYAEYAGAIADRANGVQRVQIPTELSAALYDEFKDVCAIYKQVFKHQSFFAFPFVARKILTRLGASDQVVNIFPEFTSKMKNEILESRWSCILEKEKQIKNEYMRNQTGMPIAKL